MKMEKTECSETSAYKLQSRVITQKKAYNILSLLLNFFAFANVRFMFLNVLSCCFSRVIYDDMSVIFVYLFFRIRSYTSGFKQVASETFGFVLNISDMAEFLVNNVSNITKS